MPLPEGMWLPKRGPAPLVSQWAPSPQQELVQEQVVAMQQRVLALQEQVVAF